MAVRESEERASAFVTGAGSGIGRAVAVALAERGYGVGAFDVDAKGAEATVALIAANSGTSAIPLPGDVANLRDIETAIRRTVDEFGPLAGAVANAGIWAPGDVLEVDQETWQRAFSVNVTGAFLTARVAVGAMLDAARGGSVVAVASDVGVYGSQRCAAYVASKHAVVGLVRSLALDFGPRGIRSNVVCPGFVETPLADEVFRQAPPALRDARRAEVPLGRFASPEEVAAVVEFLLSDGASFVNGAVMLCEGGATAGYFHPAAPGHLG